MDKETEERLFKEGVKEAIKELLKPTIEMASYEHGDAWLSYIIFNAIKEGVKEAKK